MDIGLNKAEVKLIIMFLDEYAELLGNNGCNDLKLDNTPENREIVKSAEKDQSGEDWNDTVPKGKSFYTTDFVVVGYLADKLKKALK